MVPLRESVQKYPPHMNKFNHSHHLLVSHYHITLPMLNAIVSMTLQVVIQKINDILGADAKIDAFREVFQFRLQLDRFEQIVKRSLNIQIKEIKSLFQFEYDKEYLPKNGDDEESEEGESSLNSYKSDLYNISSKIDVENKADEEVYTQWMDEVKKLRRIAEGKYSKSKLFFEGIRSESRFEPKSSKSYSYGGEESSTNKISWEPLKIIIGPETKNRHIPCIIPICDPANGVRDENLTFDNSLEKTSLKSLDEISKRSLKRTKINSAQEPQINSNIELFFKHQVKRKAYFKSLYLLTEHHKQINLLIRSLHLAIEEYPLLIERNCCSVSRAINQIKSVLKEQVKDIDNDVHHLYVILGINDISDINASVLPKPEHLYVERKYGFIEENYLKNLIHKYVSENKLIQDKVKAMQLY